MVFTATTSYPDTTIVLALAQPQHGPVHAFNNPVLIKDEIFINAFSLKMGMMNCIEMLFMPNITACYLEYGVALIKEAGGTGAQY